MRVSVRQNVSPRGRSASAFTIRFVHAAFRVKNRAWPQTSPALAADAPRAFRRLRLGGAGHCGGRDDGCAVGARDDGGGTGAGLRAGAAGGCGGSGIFISISMTADSSLAISRVVWS
jgi:hypothetical protein